MKIQYYYQYKQYIIKIQIQFFSDAFLIQYAKINV